MAIQRPPFEPRAAGAPLQPSQYGVPPRDTQPVAAAPVVDDPGRRAAKILDVESAIGRDLVIEGQGIRIRSKGTLRVNGVIQGEIHGRQVLVGQDAHIEGSVTGDVVEVNGRVNGAVRGTRVVLHPGAVVDGDVIAKSLLIDDGASFEGRVTRATDPEAITPQVEAQLLQHDRPTIVFGPGAG